MSREDRTGAVLLLVGLILAALGQFYFAYRRVYVWDGVVVWVAAIIFLSLTLRRFMRSERGLSQGQRSRRGWLARLREHPVRSALGCVGMGLSIYAGWWARQRPGEAGYADLLALWLIGVTSFLSAFLPPISDLRALWSRLVDRVRAGRWLDPMTVELVGLGALMGFAFVVRAYDLEHIPANLGGDEGTWAMEGLAMLDGRLANPFSTRWFAFPSMSFLVWGVSMGVFGDTVAGLRAVSAVIGAASVLTTFLLAWEVWNRRIAWLAALVLAASHYHLHYSRLAVNNIADSLFVTAAMYLLIRGLSSRRLVAFAGAGAVMGAGWYGYFGARLVGVIAAMYLAWQMVVEHRFLARYGAHLLALLGAALVVAAPLLIHYAAHPTALTEGLDRVSIFASGWLAREQEITGRSAVSLLLQQAWRSISAFNYTLDPTFWYRPGIPLLDFVSSVLFIVGMIWCVAHWRWSSSVLLMIWFWSALITGWVITENPPSSQRLVIVTPALALLVAVGLDTLMRLSRRLLDARRSMVRGLATGIVLVIVIVNLRFYFWTYTPARVYGNPTAEMTTRLARQLEREGDDKVVYLHGPPFVYWDFGTLRFMARGVSGMNVPPEGQGDPPKPDLSRGARFVFHPARLEELANVQERYPDGVEERVHSSADGELLYALYEVDG